MYEASLRWTVSHRGICTRQRGERRTKRLREKKKRWRRADTQARRFHEGERNEDKVGEKTV